jgi:hypothetical protein
MVDPVARPAPQIGRLVQELARRRVSWVMSGSTVAALYGAALAPNDLDVVPALDAENLTRLAGLLGELDARPAFIPPPFEGPTLEQCRAWRPDPPTAGHLDHLFVTALGLLDVPMKLTASYEQLRAGARPVTLAGVRVWVCDPWQVLDRLPSKARAKDVARAATYTALRERLRQDPDPDPRALTALGTA